MPSNTPPLPHDTEMLYRLAGRAVQTLGVPDRWREDAVAEYVTAAFEAGKREDAPGNVQAYQCERGRGAILHFMRRERRHEALSPASCPKGAGRVSLDKMVMDPLGEWIPMAETIEDRAIPQPDARMLEVERNEAVRRAMAELDAATRDAAQRVWIDGQTQREAAEALGISRQALQRLLTRARARLREQLAAYEPEFNRTRY